MNLFKRHPRDDLSAYIDGELSHDQATAVETHLASCPACAAEIESMREVQSQLAALPEVQRSRSFTLTPEMAQRPLREPARLRQPARVAAMTNGMRVAAAGFAAAFAIVMVLNFSGSGSENTASDNARSLTELGATQPANAYTSQSPQITKSESEPVAGGVGSPAEAPDQSPANLDNGSQGSGGGAASGGTSGFVPGSTGSTSSGEDSVSVPPATPNGPVYDADGHEIVPSVAPVISPLTDKQVTGANSGSNGDTASPVPAAAQENRAPAADASDSSGLDTLTVLAILLGAGAVLAVAGSLIYPRLNRD
jgi:hypothetical protein